MTGPGTVPGAGGAERVLAATFARPATLGRGRLVCIDGPAGSGKTTLARELVALSGAEVVHMDDLYEGWSGLSRVADQLGALLRPLATARPGHYRRWDWPADRWAETVSVAPTPLLVLEGVGSGPLAYADLVTLLVWVEAPPDLRLARGLERDGAAMADRWRQWAVDEQAVFARERTRERADVRLDGGPGSSGAP